MRRQQGPSAGRPPGPIISEGPSGPILYARGIKAGWVEQGPTVPQPGVYGPANGNAVAITGAPQGLVTLNRVNDDPIRFQSVNRLGLNEGYANSGVGTPLSNPQTLVSGQNGRAQAPQAISSPLHTQWTPKLTGRAGPRQWSSTQAGFTYWLPPVWPSQGRRTTISSVSLPDYQYGDRYLVPAIYVGQTNTKGQ